MHTFTLTLAHKRWWGTEGCWVVGLLGYRVRGGGKRERRERRESCEPVTMPFDKGGGPLHSRLFPDFLSYSYSTVNVHTQ